MLVVAALAALAALPASAPAAINITDYSVVSANAQAGAASDVDITMQFCTQNTSDPNKWCLGGSDGSNGEFQNGLQRLAIGFPPGLVANTQGIPQCPINAFRGSVVSNLSGNPFDLLCPANSKIGEVEAYTTAGNAGALTPRPDPSSMNMTKRAQSAVYNLPPQGSEVARIGIFIEPDGIDPVHPILMEVPISLNGANGYGVTATTSDFTKDTNTTAPGNDPGRTANSHPVGIGVMIFKIAKLHIKLYGHASNGSPFMQNPTSCDPSYATLTANSFFGSNAGAQLGESSQRTAVYQATGCSNVAFSPSLTVKAGGTGQTAPNSSPPVNMSVAVPDDQASIDQAKVVLPESIRPKVSALAAHTCAKSTYDAGGCPAGARIGNLSINSPLSNQGISGPIYLVRDSKDDVNQLRLRLIAKLSGAVSMDVSGTATFTGNRSVATFNELPDVPISDFGISLYGGGDGIFTAMTDLCDSSLSADSTLSGANGKSVSSQIPITIEGCAAGASASIVSSTVDVDSGYAPILVHCSAQGRRCAGSLAVPGGTPGKVDIAAGATRTVAVKLSAATVKTLTKNRTLGLKATVSGNAPTSRNVTLKAEPKAKKKKRKKRKKGAKRSSRHR